MKAIEQKANKDLVTKTSLLAEVSELDQALGMPTARSSRPKIIYILLDCSGSMAGDKLAAATTGAMAFTRDAQRLGHSLGLITFDSSATFRLAPTHMAQPMAKELRSLTANGSTALAEAIDLARERLTLPTPRLIYLISDGVPDSVEAALAAAERAKKSGIEIMTLGTDDADRDFLRRLATRTELSSHVSRAQLADGIASMVKLLGN